MARCLHAMKKLTLAEVVASNRQCYAVLVRGLVNDSHVMKRQQNMSPHRTTDKLLSHAGYKTQTTLLPTSLSDVICLQCRHSTNISNKDATKTVKGSSFNIDVTNKDVTETVSNESKIDPCDSGTDSDIEDSKIRPALEAVTPNVPPPHFVTIVPGKGPPPEPPITCCMSGCANCVWIQYAEELKQYFSAEEGKEIAKEAIEQIDNPGLQMFLKLELGLL